MNARIVRRVAAKELRETLRDRRTVLMMVVMPVFLYPVLFIVMEQLALLGQRSLQERASVVAVIGPDTGLLRFLGGDSALRLVEAGPDGAGSVRDGRLDAVVVSSAPAASEGSAQVRLLYDATRDRSQHARQLLTRRLDEWGDTLLARRLETRGLPRSFARPLMVADTSLASAQKMGGYTLGRFLPTILILMTILGAVYPAIDLSAGEKERGTLETLLTAPAPARDIVAGKFAAVALLALGSALLNLGSMLLTFQSGLFRLTRSAGITFSVPLGSLLIIAAVLVPLAVFFAALFLGISVRAESFKEAQNAITPVYIASFIPTLLAMMPGIEFTPMLALVPVGGVVFLARELLTGGAPFTSSMIALVSTVIYAALALLFAARQFGREEVLFGSGSGKGGGGTITERVRAWRSGGGDGRQPLPSEALIFVAGVALLFFYVGRVVGGAGERGVLLSQWLLLALPTAGFIGLGRYSPQMSLALRPPSARTLLAAVLIAVGAIPLGWALGWLQLQFFDFPEGMAAALEALTRAGDTRRMLWLLLVVALTPAICEELVFRGILLNGLARDLPGWKAVGLSAVVFGAFHLSFETVIRFLPTAFLGVLMGYVVWRSRSVFASMLMHFLNNGIAVLIISLPALRSWVITDGGEPAWGVVLVAPLLVAAGLRLLPARGPDDRQPGAA